MTTLRESTTHILSPDTQAVLLLCGRFGRDAPAAKPLAQAEYDRLAEWLLQHKMRPADLLDPATAARRQGPGLGLPLPAARLTALLERGGALALAVESWTNKGLWVISRSDETYPQRLKSGRRGPPILYGAGNRALLTQGGLAVVGSRDVAADALRYTGEVAEACAAQGITVVSGGARGVDSQAMEAALDAGGPVVGVLADSLAKMVVAGKYRQGLLAGNLVLISPYDPGAGFDVGNAMGRNKYIYSLADWALVVTSTVEKGGTWTGAVEALKLGKTPLFVRVAGQALEGNHKLLELGARPFPAAPWPDLQTQLAQAVADNPAPTGAQAPLPFPTGAPAAPSRRDPVLTAGAAPDLPPEPAETRPDRSNRPGGAPPALVEPQTGTAFDRVLPLMLAYLAEPRDVKTLATLLDVPVSQAQIWLKRAVQEEKVLRVGKPARYVAAAPRLWVGLSA